MRAVLPPDLVRVDEPHVGLVDERRGLERVAGALAPHVAAREAAHLVVDERDEGVERLPVACPPGLQQARDLL